ncbi:MAG: preprotein translocase subunit SecA [Lachnospiraceae bacterium]|nr:preprotein translocase subunit SecA [Lachnospiraceae bacterium]MDY4970809.1 preprotein translocase subunit SecA [Lachnospiraceae bacterium]
MGLFTKIFGTYSERELKLINPIVNKIIALKPQMESLSDEELRGKTDEFKARLAKGETLDDLLPEAFAVVREAGRRVLGMEHYPVQLTGGIILHQGRIAEMKTGEGKTLVSTLPAYLNALEGKGVHIVTVNDYLAQRDAEWMGQIHRFLGLTVGVVLNSMNSEERREAYACDITYVTNNELGFDYLRDNMVLYKKDLVLRDLHYAIIDEVDSVLIDEARTPLIISGQGSKSSELYEQCDRLARQLVRGTFRPELTKMELLLNEDPEADEDGDYVVNEKDKIVTLTAAGIKKVEQFFRIDNLADPENLEKQHNIILALRAHNLMREGHDYIVKDDQVLIIDEFTGRIMPGRRYSDGLHQAIEAKEGVKIKRENKTIATITFQNFFNKFAKKAGMTGTAMTEAKEFQDIYGMDVVEVPTNRPVIRIDKEDAVFTTQKEKYRAVVKEVVKAHEKGRPVLVGTTSIQNTEMLRKMINDKGIRDVEVLNAKMHEQEARIVANAGLHGAITIATNMAGRGTDIKLDDEARAAGGLLILGTERHEARRIDNQLRGRSGRQGDPGESRFFISLEDDLMRLFGSERMIGVFSKIAVEDEEITHKSLSDAIRKAQEKIEHNHFGIRKNLFEYDQVDNEQREIIYAERRKVLDGENMRDVIINMIQDIIDHAVDMCISDEQDPEEWNMAELSGLIRQCIPLKISYTKEELEKMNAGQLKQSLKEQAVKLYELKESEYPTAEMMREVERIILLRTIDIKWMDHIDDMVQLRQGIGLQSYGQKDPLVEYKMAAFDMFEALTASIQEETVRRMYAVTPKRQEERTQVVKVTGTNKDDSAGPRIVKRSGRKVYPNDPCPCGSGKKYKQCCGRK